jgi:mono/diheme cytochrome c family protein
MMFSRSSVVALALPGWRTSLRMWAVAASAACTGVVLAQGQPGSVERGRYLVEGIMACGNCHIPRGPQGQPLLAQGLSGGMVIEEPPFKAVASNITPDVATGIGRWSDAQLGKAIREGLRPDGSLIGPPMPSPNYRHLSDDDLKAVIAYLRAQPAVNHAVPKSEYRMPLPPAYGPPLTSVQAPKRTDTVAYGRYLAEAGHCMECHTPRNAQGMLEMDKVGAGGQSFNGPWGTSVARNLTAHTSGLKNWSDAQIARAIREGVDRDGKPYKPPMAFGFYQRLNAEDMTALVAYLRALPPQPTGGSH